MSDEDKLKNTQAELLDAEKALGCVHAPHGERIDFFMFHSWHDGAERKQSAFELFVADFQQYANCESTFWLDKVGINQKRIAIGLDVLPMSLMACQIMLVLCGQTRATRLGCMCCADGGCAASISG